MNQTPPAPRVTPEQWDALRQRFQQSMMLQTSIAALAENIDGCVWPIRAADETPSDYVDLPYSGALSRLRARGLQDAELDKLVVILRGTLAFDDSFGEMVDIAGRAEADLDPVSRNLSRLGIPADFPVDLCHLKPATVEFCAREGIKVIDDFLLFARSTSRQVIVGEDFRDLLNALTHLDESTVARFLPLRGQTGGLFFVEALAQLLRPLSEEERQQLVLQPTRLSVEARAKGNRLAVYFSAQIEEMRAALAAGTPLSRLVAPLNDLTVEPAVASVLRLFIDPNTLTPTNTAAAPKRPGFWRRLFSFGKTT